MKLILMLALSISASAQASLAHEIDISEAGSYRCITVDSNELFTLTMPHEQSRSHVSLQFSSGPISGSTIFYLKKDVVISAQGEVSGKLQYFVDVRKTAITALCAKL